MRYQVLVQLPTTRDAGESTADHAKFEELKGPFSSGPEVTTACLGCHNEAGNQFTKSIHWTWEYEHPQTGQKLGKKTLINTFCTNARGNEGKCAQCHGSFIWSVDLVPHYAWFDGQMIYNQPSIVTSVMRNRGA